MGDREKLELINLESVQRFLRETGATDNCMSCGTDSWVFMGHNDRGYFFGLPFGRATSTTTTLLSIDGGSRPVVAMACTRCGFIRQHDAFIIGNWLSQNEIEGSAHDSD